MPKSSVDPITQPGVYELEHDLLLCAGSDPSDPHGAITIAASHVKLDLEGHTVSCDTNAVPGLEYYGIVVKPGLTKVHIKDGTVTGCNYGVWLTDNRNSSVRNMVVTDTRRSVPWTFLSGRGIRAISTQNLKIIGNRVSGTEGAGISLRDSDRARVHRNIVTESYGGIGGGAKNSEFTCNVASRNLIAGLEVVGPAGTATGNVLRGNVASYNGSVGIAVYGDADNPEQWPIPEDNRVRNNIALGNGLVDAGEYLFGFISGIGVVDDVCHNTWRKNQIIVAVGPPGCVGTPVQLDNDDVCALDTDDDDDSDSDDDD